MRECTIQHVLVCQLIDLTVSAFYCKQSKYLVKGTTMLWPLIKESIPTKSLLFIALAGLLWFFGLQSLLLIVLFIGVELVMWYTSASTTPAEFVYTKNIIALFAVENSQLRVGMDRGSVKRIKQIKLWQDNQHGFIDFELNYQLKVRYKFPIQQYQAFRQWLQQALPHSQIIDSFKS